MALQSMKMDKYQARRRNLQQLLDERFGGVVKQLADAIGKDPSYVSRMLWEEGKKGAKRIGEDMADTICDAVKLPRGTLDREGGAGKVAGGEASSVGNQAEALTDLQQRYIKAGDQVREATDTLLELPEEEAKTLLPLLKSLQQKYRTKPD